MSVSIGSVLAQPDLTADLPPFLHQDSNRVLIALPADRAIPAIARPETLGGARKFILLGLSGPTSIPATLLGRNLDNARTRAELLLAPLAEAD
ncbi:hypothetical protein ACFXPS_05785 [Nocardia sp. NPDC059091]|uniref:hypothetical protein n=1 Tax=unclassified Nocardia TaxID=2637762 RepID=UPI0036A97969